MNPNEQIFLRLGKFARNFNHRIFLESLKHEFNYLPNKNFIDKLGFELQVTVKKSRPMYLHGYLLACALHKYLLKNTQIPITILETGTARGFSSLILAKMLEHNQRNGTIHTLDLALHEDYVFNNCWKAVKMRRPVSRKECLIEWQDTCDKYIKFYGGDSKKTLEELELPRIHMAFLDGYHTYEYVKMELEFVKDRQEAGDIIVCDDYTAEQYPEIVKAIDEFTQENLYQMKIFYGNDGLKSRGYVYLVRK